MVQRKDGIAIGLDLRPERRERLAAELRAPGTAAILDAMNQAVSRLHAYEKPGDEADEMGA
jgi:hypothetical protein